MQTIATQVLVLGSGAAGLCAAIEAREQGADVLLASNTRLGKANATAVAGGLINAALGIADPQDNPVEHARDTLRAGAYLGDPQLVAALVEDIPVLIPRLQRYGVNLARLQDGCLYQFLSPGHSRPRTVVTFPRQGTSLTMPLASRARQLGVRWLEDFCAHQIVVEQGRVTGVLGYQREADAITWIAAPAVVLATGGSGVIYDRNRIPPMCLGNGVGLALEAGCSASDLEFVQYYPTILTEPGAPRAVIDYLQTLRQGARILNTAGTDVLEKHGLAAPETITRDQLAVALGREIHDGLADDGALWMDFGQYQIPKLDFPSRFHRWLNPRLEQGLSRVRVAPFCHYFMGGVRIDADCETGIPGLMACGEVAGDVHGGNRLQGNALAETIVFGFRAGARAAAWAANEPAKGAEPQPAALLQQVFNRQQPVLVNEAVATLQQAVSTHLGLVRHRHGIEQAIASIAGLTSDLPSMGAVTPYQRMLLTALPGMLTVAHCIAVAALARCESRAAHYRLDYPAPGHELAKIVHYQDSDSHNIITTTIPWKVIG